MGVRLNYMDGISGSDCTDQSVTPISLVFLVTCSMGNFTIHMYGGKIHSENDSHLQICIDSKFYMKYYIVFIIFNFLN